MGIVSVNISASIVIELGGVEGYRRWGRGRGGVDWGFGLLGGATSSEGLKQSGVKCCDNRTRNNAFAYND